MSKRQAQTAISSYCSNLTLPESMSYRAAKTFNVPAFTRGGINGPVVSKWLAISTAFARTALSSGSPGLPFVSSTAGPIAFNTSGIFPDSLACETAAATAPHFRGPGQQSGLCRGAPPHNGCYRSPPRRPLHPLFERQRYPGVQHQKSVAEERVNAEQLTIIAKVFDPRLAESGQRCSDKVRVSILQSA